MTKLNTNLTHTVALAALIGGTGACAESGEDLNRNDADPVEAAAENLGIPINGCETATAMNGAGFASGTLQFNVDTDPLVLSAAGGVFTANGIKCVGPVSNVTQPLKTAAVQQIVIKGTTNDNKVILDFLPGTFGTKVLGAMGGIVIDFAGTVATPGAGKDAVMIRASALAETYKFASLAPATPTSIPTEVYVEVTGDKLADIDIKTSTTGTLSLTASMGGGNDIVTAATLAAEIEKFAGAPSTAITVGALPSALGVIAYGGLGDDKFTGGLGDDQFFGGEGNDTFNSTGTSTSDGADVYSGDNGNDTVEYGARTVPLRVDLGPLRPAIEGASDLRNPNLYGTNGLLAGKTLSLVIDGVRIPVAFTTGPANPAALLTRINAVLTTAGAASLTAKNHLAITSATSTGTSFVKIEDGPGIPVAANGAEATLGLATGVAATSPLSGNVDLTTPALLGAGGTLNGQRLVLLVNGVFVVVTLTAPATADAIVAAINAAANAALGTTGVLYAAHNATTHFLEITATTLDVKDGTLAQATLTTSAAGLLGFRSRIEGTTDMTTASLFGAGTLANTTLSVVIDGARVDAGFGATPANAAAVTGPINTIANNLLHTNSVVYAAVDAVSHHLILTSGTDVGGVSGIRFVTDPAIAVGTGANAAEARLGLTLNSSGSKIVGGDISLAGLYGASGTLAGTSLTLVINGEYVQVEFADGTGGTTALADSTALLAAINGAANTALGTTGVVYASQTSLKHKLQLSAASVIVRGGLTAYGGSTAAQAILGLSQDVAAKHDIFDADDGIVGERDDVRYSTENINGGTASDVLIGNALKNTIKGGAGNDFIAGGANALPCTLTEADSLQGGDGDDTFLMPTANCKAILQGGDGTNTADFSGRTTGLSLKNNGTADDGEPAVAAANSNPAIDQEGVNIGADIKKLVGGFGADSFVGGSTDDIFVGGLGSDTFVGGAGIDTVDYSDSLSGVNVSLCFTAALATCGNANDGIPVAGAVAAEGDQVYQVEHLVGSAYDDTFTTGATTTVSLTMEGGSGDDVITGGDAVDELWGDDGDDTLNGGADDDSLSGDLGKDTLNGEVGDGDICLGDANDVVVVPSTCEF